jgi:hypothetical protein
MPVGAQNDTDPFQRQSKLEAFEKNKISKLGVVRCGNNPVVWSPDDLPLALRGKRRSRLKWAFPSANGSRYNRIAQDIFWNF